MPDGARVVEVDGGTRAVRVLSRALAEAFGGGPPVLPVDPQAPQARATVAAMRPDDPMPESAAVLIATSGSSGHPKGVLLPAAALTASARATHARLGGPGRWLLATPAQYIGGLQVLVRSLLSGLEPGVLDLSAGFRPDAFAAAAEPVLAEPGPRYTALVPTQLVRILDAGGRALRAARG
ncbi:MAG: AMP-binding protein, partial [Thermocrispum sp.]